MKRPWPCQQKLFIIKKKLILFDCLNWTIMGDFFLSWNVGRVDRHNGGKRKHLVELKIFEKVWSVSPKVNLNDIIKYIYNTKLNIEYIENW